MITEKKKSVLTAKQQAVAAELVAAAGVSPKKSSTKKAAAKKAAANSTKKPKKKKPTKSIGARIKVISEVPQVLKEKEVPKAPKAPKAPKGSGVCAGQSGPLLVLPAAALSRNEGKVLEILKTFPSGMDLASLAKQAFPKLPKAKGNSWVRNALRRLVRAQYAEKIGRGSYCAR